MINPDKIGKFIVELRNKKNLSQEKLGNLIGIGRESISKWERGVTLPSHEMLLKLSDVFGVTVNEILYGECLNSRNEEKINEMSAILYENANKCKKLVKRLLIAIVCMLALFGIYYFINSYKSIKVYTISAEGENIFIDNGVFVKTRGKLYFSINELNVKKGLKVKMLTLYYKDKENIIYSGDDTNVFIRDYYGANEYFNIKYLSDITDNLYLLIEYDNGNYEDIKLFFNQDYVNDVLLFKKTKSLIDDNDKEINTNDIELVPADLKHLIKNIKDTYKKEENIYTYNKVIEETEYSTFYYPEKGIISLIVLKNKYPVEDWIFYTHGKTLEYNMYDDKEVKYSFVYENDSIKCTFGKCEKEKDKVEFFWSFLYNNDIK